MTGSEPRPRRIGIMGGSFDPVHAGHLALAESALQHTHLDQVRWVPVGQAWQKSRALAPASHRLEMVRLAVQHEPRFVVDDIEIRRSGPSYTLDTVRDFQSQEPQAQWFLILGLDQYRNLPTWHGWQELLARVDLAVACRESDALPDFTLGRATALPMPPIPVSSTDIRQQLLAGRDPESLAPTLVSEPVARYIAQHQLYADRHNPLNGHP